MSSEANKQGEDARARVQSQMEMVLQQQGGLYASPQQQLQQQQQRQQQHQNQQKQQHLIPGFEHLYCQYPCPPPPDSTGAVHAAAAVVAHQRHPHPPQHPQQAAQFTGPTSGGTMHHVNYAIPYPTQPHEMAQQLQSHFVAAAAMNQYAASNYGRGLQEQLDPYLNQHLQQYHPQKEIPRGYMISSPVTAGPYFAQAPQLSYYAHQYPGMMPHMAAASGESSTIARVSGGPAEAAPPPLRSSQTTPQQQQPLQQPKESILSSLLAARSERLAAGVDDGESTHGADKAAEAVVASLASSSSSSAPATNETATGGPVVKQHLHSSGALGRLADAAMDASSNRTEPTKSAVSNPSASPISSAVNHLHRPPIMASPPHPGAENSGNGGAGAGGMGAAAAALTAATAIHLTGMRGGFPAARMHHPIGGMSGMAPTMPTAVAMPAVQQVPQGPYGLPCSNQLPIHRHQPPDAAAMSAMQYVGQGPVSGTGPLARSAPAMGTGPPPQAMSFGSHDVFEEHMRQQEKKLQKRAANRKSAQLSRKRKKALIEELKYENEDLQRHEDILAVIPDPVFAFDALNGGVWFASNSASAQFGLTVEDLTSACFFDLMTKDCSKRLRVLIDTASKDLTATGSTLLYERMTVRFKKRKAAILLGDLSGRLARQGDGITAVCSVRPLSSATEDMLGKGYYGDASVSELAAETSSDQGSSGEDSRSGGAGLTSSTADSSSGVGTGCTSNADEGSSSVPSLSSLEVKSGGGGRCGVGGASKSQGRSGGKGGGGVVRSSSSTTAASSSSIGAESHATSSAGSGGSTGAGEGSAASAASIGTSGDSVSGSSGSGVSGSGSGSGSNNGSEAGEGNCGSPSAAEEYNTDSPLSYGSGRGNDQYHEDDARSDDEQEGSGSGRNLSPTNGAETTTAAAVGCEMSAATPLPSRPPSGNAGRVLKSGGDWHSSGKLVNKSGRQGTKNVREARAEVSSWKRRRCDKQTEHAWRRKAPRLGEGQQREKLGVSSSPLVSDGAGKARSMGVDRQSSAPIEDGQIRFRKTEQRIEETGKETTVKAPAGNRNVR